MKQKNLKLLLVSVPLVTVAGCSGGSNDGTPPPPPTTVTAQEDTFGVRFGAAFRTDPNGTAIEPAAGDIIPLSLTAEPIEIK